MVTRKYAGIFKSREATFSLLAIAIILKFLAKFYGLKGTRALNKQRLDVTRMQPLARLFLPRKATSEIGWCILSDERFTQNSILSLSCENRLEYRMTAGELSRKSNVVPFGELSEFTNTRMILRAWFTRFFEGTDRFIAELSLLKRETICSRVKRGTPLFLWISLDEFVWTNLGNVLNYKFYLRLRCEEILEKRRTLTEFQCLSFFHFDYSL